MSSQPEINSKPEPVPVNGSKQELVVSSTNGAEPRRKANHGAGIQPIHGFGTVTLKPEFALYKAVRNGLRGRMLWVIGLGILIGTLGAYVGSRLSRPTYESSGLVYIAYELPTVLSQTDQNGPMQNFDTFMQSQKLLITSRAVQKIAVDDRIWNTTPHGVPADPEYYFSKHLTVTINPRSEYIQITASDIDPEVAHAAASSMTDAYAEVYQSHEQQLEGNRKDILTGNRDQILRDIKQTTDNMSKIDSQYGTSNLSEFYDAAFDQVGKTAAALDDVRTAIAVAASKGATSQPTSTQPTSRTVAESGEELTVEQIAARDTKMQGYVDREKILENELQVDLINLGENHDLVIALRKQIEQDQSQVEKYADLYRQFNAATGQNLGAPGNTPIATAGRSLESLRDSESRLALLLENEKAEMRDLGEKRMRLDAYRADLASEQDHLNRVLSRLDALQSEGATGGPFGRLRVESDGETPLGPTTDPRLKLASVGALAGAVLPAIFFILQSLIVGSRYKYSDDTHVNGAADIPLIGIVPSLNADAHPGDELSQAAAQSIHQIRVSLTSDSTNGDESAVYLVTSASAGEGKTSLSMSIGLSFAGAGVRTLLIDCDMLGRQLTECLGALDKPGLQEALGSGTLHNRIHKISRKLYYVPTGQVRRADACSISPARLRLVLAQARRHFDVVLIDSGPILGSVEASVLAREVDGVLFAVSQNQRRAVVERAIQRLASLDARLDGLIFNRARPEDFESSSYGSSSGRSTVSWKSNGNYIEDPPEGKFGQFGLLVQAVASTMHRNAALEKSTVAKS